MSALFPYTHAWRTVPWRSSPKLWRWPCFFVSWTTQELQPLDISLLATWSQQIFCCLMIRMDGSSLRFYWLPSRLTQPILFSCSVAGTAICINFCKKKIRHETHITETSIYVVLLLQGNNITEMKNILRNKNVKYPVCLCWNSHPWFQSCTGLSMDRYL